MEAGELEAITRGRACLAFLCQYGLAMVGPLQDVLPDLLAGQQQVLLTCCMATACRTCWQASSRCLLHGNSLPDLCCVLPELLPWFSIQTGPAGA